VCDGIVRRNIEVQADKIQGEIFRKVTNATSDQKRYFKMVGIRNSMSLENFVW
jgi:hypothetical protein